MIAQFLQKAVLLPLTLNFLFSVKAEIICRITMFETMVSEGGIVKTEEKPRCIPIINGTESDEDFSIALPQDLIEAEKQRIEVGELIVSFDGAARLENDELVVGENPYYTVMEDEHFRHLKERHLTITKEMTVAVILVSTRDSSPTDSVSSARNALFGEGKPNFPAQYDACSFGKLKWKLSDYGIQAVTIPNSITEFKDAPSLITAVQRYLKEELDVIAVSQLADKVIMCLPPGTGNWAASAGVNHWRAQMNDSWCTSLSGTMHEIAHTLGMLHANSADEAYADRSGYMGSGYTSPVWPRKCFNAVNHYKFGWFFDKTKTMDPRTVSGTVINLATFVDYEIAAPSEPVLLNLADKYFLQYNRAKGFNSETEQKRDQVTVTESNVTGTKSLAGLSADDLFIIPNFMGSERELWLQACGTKIGDNGAEIMEISIAFDESLCWTRGGDGESTFQAERSPAQPDHPWLLALLLNFLLSLNLILCN